jgi:hypothetical protein
VSFRLNPPPGWPPVPAGFAPLPGWQPDPSWPAPPPGWQLWLPEDETPAAPALPFAPPFTPPPSAARLYSPHPPYQYPAGSPYGGPPYGPAQATSGLAIASLVLGIAGFLTITAVAGIVLGIVALTQLRSRYQRGRGLAIAGITVSAVWLVLMLAVPLLLNAGSPVPVHFVPPVVGTG